MSVTRRALQNSIPYRYQRLARRTWNVEWPKGSICEHAGVSEGGEGAFGEAGARGRAQETAWRVGGGAGKQRSINRQWRRAG